MDILERDHSGDFGALIGSCMYLVSAYALICQLFRQIRLENANFVGSIVGEIFAAKFSLFSLPESESYGIIHFYEAK